MTHCDIGTASKEKFENIQVTDASTEANIIKSNGTFIAVSGYKILIFAARSPGTARVAVSSQL